MGNHFNHQFGGFRYLLPLFAANNGYIETQNGLFVHDVIGIYGGYAIFSKATVNHTEVVRISILLL